MLSYWIETGREVLQRLDGKCQYSWKVRITICATTDRQTARLGAEKAGNFHIRRRKPRHKSSRKPRAEANQFEQLTFTTSSTFRNQRAKSRKRFHMQPFDSYRPLTRLPKTTKPATANASEPTILWLQLPRNIHGQQWRAQDQRFHQRRIPDRSRGVFVQKKGCQVKAKIINRSYWFIIDCLKE